MPHIKPLLLSVASLRHCRGSGRRQSGWSERSLATSRLMPALRVGVGAGGGGAGAGTLAAAMDALTSCSVITFGGPSVTTVARQPIALAQIPELDRLAAAKNA